MAAWKTVKLSEVCEIQRGGSPRPIENFITDADNGINWIKIGDVTKGAKYITSTKEKIKPEGAQRSRSVQEGEFLLSNSMSFGRPYILRTSGCIHDGWLVLRYDKELMTEDYLYHVLGSDLVYAQFVKFAVGAVVKNLNSEVVKQVSIPLPPLKEQRRIAAILDQADALRAKRREALAQLDSLTQSIFIEMFGDPKTNPYKWEVTPLGSHVQLQGGFAFKSTDYVSEGIRLVKISNVHKDNLTWNDIDYLPPAHLEGYCSFSLLDGDIVMALTRPIIQSLESVKVAVVSSTDIPCLLNQRVGRFVFRNKTKLCPEYLLGFCRTTAFFREVKRFCSESLQPNISTFQVESLNIPIPPEPLQAIYRERIRTIERLIGQQRQSVAYLDSLFASLQHRAFRGEL